LHIQAIIQDRANGATATAAAAAADSSSDNSKTRR